MYAVAAKTPVASFMSVACCSETATVTSGQHSTVREACRHYRYVPWAQVRSRAGKRAATAHLMAFDGCVEAKLVLTLVTIRIGDVHIADVAIASTENLIFHGQVQASAITTFSQSI
jgi:hypothetical protein